MQSFCRTCLIQISDTSSSVSLDYKGHKHQLIFCIPEMDLRAFPDGKLCRECVTALNAIYKFKMKCRIMETQINQQQFNVTEHSMVTQDVYLRNNIYTVCRTCLDKVIDNSFHLGERLFSKSKLIFCVPEVNLQVMSDINLCNYCNTILDKMYLFKLKCLDVEKSIKEYLKLQDKVDFRGLLVSYNTFVKYEGSGLEEYTIKQEEIDLVNEDEIKEDFKEQITNDTLNSLKTEKSKTCECIKITSQYKICRCYDSIYDNVQHLVSDKSKNNFKHSKSSYNTDQKHSLIEGIHSHPGEKQFKCLLCDYSAARKSHLKNHIRTHTGEKPFKCSLCEYSAADSSSLNNHIRTHTGEKPFKCSLCEYSAARRSTLKNHIHTHATEKPFKCSLCNYSAAQKSHLKNHLCTHTDEKPFKCSLCEYSAVRKSTLKIHTHTHTNEKPFKCLLCEYSAARKSTLNKHIRTHTGEKPFKCSLCEYSTADNSSLKNHIRMHTGEKPFKCSLCEYSAVRKSTLKIHMHIHTSVKLFKCPLCEYSTTQKSTLNKHIPTHTGENSYRVSTSRLRKK